MKRIFAAVCVLLVLGVRLGHAQAGAVCLFSDASGTDCSIHASSGLVYVYVVHTQTTGASAVEFTAQKPACLFGAFVEDTPQFPVTIGSSQTGVSVGYGSCRASPIHVLTITYLCSEPAPVDCPYPVLPFLDNESIRMVDCNFELHDVPGTVTYINSNLPCTCYAPQPPFLDVNPPALDFGATSVTKTFGIANAGGGTLEWNVAESVPWLIASPASGTQAGTVTVSVDRVGLDPGPYTGAIDVTSNGGDVTVDVIMEVSTPILAVSPESLVIPSTSSSSSLSISNIGGGTIEWSISADQPWLLPSPAAGTGDQAVSVTVDRTGLGDGTYHGNLFVSSNGGNTTVPVEMTVITGPILYVNPNYLVFLSTMTKSFGISNAGIGTLSWSLSTDRPWIEILSPMSGSGNATIQVRVDQGNVPCCGQQIGHISIASNGGDATIEVLYDPTALSQGGSVGIYANASGTDCNLPDVTRGLTTYYVVHTISDAATGCGYWAPKPACFTATWLSDTNPFPVTIGNSQTGVSIGYGSCRYGSVLVQTLSFFTNGTTPNCCFYPVRGIPTSGEVEVVDCLFNLRFGQGVMSVVNATPGCPCTGINVKVEDSTWGRVKALYSDD